ncbi:hypothetical protein TRP8649_02310 [Pelagimonas phthalicica]|uniref:Uncharacterized protein n=1 Tax=Pelagimonas phthalicica TaxID=1037362 RepID=A0A238JCQ9_9RHOB|nr:hypothetical protein [Pelagimonas phthalicica]TDS91148.1 hypothetical protein CLV87_2312 [Pelagimonas phthalicica]SMX28195.1 hypothetical protein TRP8649_02310 [Pelagimonas phthalicica]
MPDLNSMPDYRRQILLAQLYNAIECLPEVGSDEAIEAVRELARDCMVALESSLPPNHLHEKVFTDHVFPRWNELFHFDERREEVSKTQMATLVTRFVLVEYLLPEGFLDVDMVTNDDFAELTASDFEPGARVGAQTLERPDLMWATTMQDVINVAPSAKTERVIPFEEARTLRDHLGLVQRGANAELVLLVFDLDALCNHTDSPETQVSRPFIFEGIGNARFHLFDHQTHAPWNRALNLAAVKDPGTMPEGGREIVMTSVPCSAVERCIPLEVLDEPPCTGREKVVVDIMMRQQSIDVAKQRITQFLKEAG